MPAYKLNVSGQGFDPSKLAAVLQALLPVILQIAGMFSGTGGGKPMLKSGPIPNVTCEPMDDEDDEDDDDEGGDMDDEDEDDDEAM